MKIHSFVKPLAYSEVMQHCQDHASCPYKPRDVAHFKFAASDQPSSLKEVELFFNHFNEWTSRAFFAKLKQLATKLPNRWMELEGLLTYEKTFEMFKVLAQDHFEAMSIHDMDHYTMSRVTKCATWIEVLRLVDEYNETYFRELIQSIQETAETITARQDPNAPFYSYFEMLKNC